VNAAGIRGRSCSAGSRHSAAINSGRPASRGDERDVVAGVGMGSTVEQGDRYAFETILRSDQPSATVSAAQAAWATSIQLGVHRDVQLRKCDRRRHDGSFEVMPSSTGVVKQVTDPRHPQQGDSEVAHNDHHRPTR
jgi:hypothetical protein